MEIHIMSDPLAVKNENQKKLMKLPNVVGTGVGEKFVDGVPTGEPAILVFVEKKYSEQGIIRKYSSDELVPQALSSVPTDVIEVGKIRKHFKNKVRPLVPGYSVGHGDITAGTMGGFFRDKDGDLVVLSNNHVLANENAAKAGDLIFQPGPIDSSNDRTFRGWTDPLADLPYFATLKNFVKINKTGNTQDSAIATIPKQFIDMGLVSGVYPTIGKRASGWAVAKVGDQLQKCGRTTDYTTGRVLALHSTFTIGYDFGDAEFNECIVTTNMSKPGDSGSVIFDLNMNAMALLFAGSNKVTLANPMELVRAKYGLEIWDGGTSSPPIDIGNQKWAMFSRHGKIELVGDTFNITDSANHACYAQSPLGKFTSAECIVNTGTDAGATWGPGIVVMWPNATMKVNLRYGGGFGGYFNTDENITIGRTKPNTDYKVRIKKYKNNYVGEIYDGKQWIILVAVPASVFRGDPIRVRVGKTDQSGGASDYGTPGPEGQCSIRGFKVS